MPFTNGPSWGWWSFPKKNTVAVWGILKPRVSIGNEGFFWHDKNRRSVILDIGRAVPGVIFCCGLFSCLKKIEQEDFFLSEVPTKIYLQGDLQPFFWDVSTPVMLLMATRNPANRTCWRLGVYPIIYKGFYMPGGAGFLPSTVSYPFIHLHSPLKTTECPVKRSHYVQSLQGFWHPRWCRLSSISRFGAAIWGQGWCIFLLNEERFRTPEASKSQGSFSLTWQVMIVVGKGFPG